MALVQTDGAQPRPVLASAAAVDELSRRIGRKDATSLDPSTGYLFFRSGPPVTQVMATDFLKSIEGCDPVSVPAQYSELKWICKGRIASNRTSEAKFDKCFDAAPILVVYEVGSKALAKVIDGDDWSTQRCGKSPIFVPPPPPTPEKK
jgi:hypothetical protein